MKKVLIKSPILTQSGYGHHSRTVLRALRKREDIEIYLIALNWGACSWLVDDNEERRWIDEALNKTLEYIKAGGQFDMSIQVTIPQEFEQIAPINIGVTAGVETTKISPLWIQKSNIMDKIITISEHSKRPFVETVYDAKHPQTGEDMKFKCEVPVEYVSYPVLKQDPEELDLNLQTDFNFLTVMQMSPRKNLHQLISCFYEQFKDNEDVGLIVKTNLAKNSLIDRSNSEVRLSTMIPDISDAKCKIYLLHGNMSEGEMAGLYTHPKIKAIVSTTHGEGFGLPLFEAAYHGLPIIATDWSGHVDFLYKPLKSKNGKSKNKHMFSRISYTLQQVQKEAVWENVIVPESKWAFPEAGSIKMNLEELYKDHGRFKKRAKELQKWVLEEFEEEKQYAEYNALLEEYFEPFDVESWLEELNVETHE